VQIVQSISPSDFEARLHFARRFVEVFGSGDSLSSLMMTDEAHFNLCGFVNKQNYRFWSSENPQEIQQRPLHSQKVTVWCGVMCDRIVGPFFFEDEKGEAVTIDRSMYREMIGSFLSSSDITKS